MLHDLANDDDYVAFKPADEETVSIIFVTKIKTRTRIIGRRFQRTRTRIIVIQKTKTK